jgi:hypothetical protein
MATETADPVCLICNSHMTEPFHYPVVNECLCKSRLCQSCHDRVKACPTCRRTKSGGKVDVEFLENMTLAVKGKTCDGCHRFIRSRHTVSHAKECPALLMLRLRETRNEKERMESSYREVLRENERLSDRLAETSYHLHFLRSYQYRLHFPPPPSPPPHHDFPPTHSPRQVLEESENENENESDEEMELETHEVHPVAGTV